MHEETLRARSDVPVVGTVPLSDAELATRLRREIAAYAARHPELHVHSVEVTRGWGDVLFVRISVVLRDGSAGEEELEQQIRAVADDVLASERHTVAVRWRD